MKIVKASLCAAVAAATMSFATAASAEVTFNVGVATDYIFRGIDQTGFGTEGQVFGGVDFTGGPNLYAGAWVSNTGPDSENGVEYDLYAGWRPSAGPVSLDLGAIYYGYNDGETGAVSDDFNTLEWKAAASLAVGPATVGAAAFYSNDWLGSDEDALYYEANVSFPLKEKVILTAAIGKTDSDYGAGTVDSYVTWNAGLTIPVTDNFTIDARYVGNDDDAAAFGPAREGFVGTLKATF